MTLKEALENRIKVLETLVSTLEEAYKLRGERIQILEKNVDLIKRINK